jgi:hypothetical protein
MRLLKPSEFLGIRKVRKALELHLLVFIPSTFSLEGLSGILFFQLNPMAV